MDSIKTIDCLYEQPLRQWHGKRSRRRLIGDFIDDMKHRKPSPLSAIESALNRRQFLSKAAKGLGAMALLGGLPRGWLGGVYASDAPETTSMNFGMIALTDCSPIVIAHEKGLFKKYGINSVVTKGANWAAIRDNLSTGSIQATHMLIGMPIASTIGLAGSPKKPMIIPWLLNRNGQAITLKTEWKGKVASDPKALKPFAEKAQKSLDISLPESRKPNEGADDSLWKDAVPLENDDEEEFLFAGEVSKIM